MKGLYQKYLDNLVEGQVLAKKNLHLSESDQDSLLEQIQLNSQRAYQLRLENEDLLSRILYDRRCEDLTAEDVDELTEFVDELFAFASQNDIGTAYKIHQLLYDYAVYKGDFDLQCRQLYNLGTILYYLNPQMSELGINLFGNRVTDYFLQGAKPLERLSEIKNPETQGYILRSLSNIYISNESTTSPHQPGIPFDISASYSTFMKYFDRLMEIYNNPILRETCPDFPWEKAIYNLHFNRSQTFLDVFDPCEPDVLAGVLESSQYVYNHQEQLASFNNNTVEAHILHLYATSRWQAGQISTTELADILIDLINSGDPDDFSDTGITINLQMPLYLECAHRRMEPEDRARYDATVQRIIENTYDYLRRAPNNEFSNIVTGAVNERMRQRFQLKQPLDTHLFDTLLFCHPPTYIHVRIAAALSRRLYIQMARTMPEKLIGLCGIHDPETIRHNALDLGDHIYQCTLYHDVGKIMLLEYIGIYGRKLLDEEFAAIKLHPIIGAMLLSNTDPQEMAIIAKHHHRFYNEQGGYPADCPPCPPEYKPIVDIVTVADSIEAATDNIGRCYSSAKTFNQIIDELRRESGTRYSPDVVALFDDAEFAQSVERSLQEDRKHVYFSVYGKEGHINHTE